MREDPYEEEYRTNREYEEQLDLMTLADDPRDLTRGRGITFGDYDERGRMCLPYED